MNRMNAMLASTALGIVIGGAFLWLVVRTLDLDAAWQVLGTTDWSATLIALIAMSCMWIVKSLRWTAILRGVASLQVPDALAAVIVGAAGNVVVSHAGEALRVVAAGRRCDTSTEALLTSIAVERVFDVVIIFLMVIAAVIVAGSNGPFHVEWLLGLLGLGAICMFVIVIFAGPKLANTLEGSTRVRPSALRAAIAGRLRGILGALRLFQDHRQSLIVLAWSSLMWTCVTTCIYFCIRAVSAEATLAASILVLGVHTAALVLPAPPAKVGTTQASFALALAGTSLTSPQVFAASVIYNVLMTIPILLASTVVWRRAFAARHG